jgi:hypothetical protein
MAEYIGELAGTYRSDQSPAAPSSRRTLRLIRRRAKADGQFLDFQTNVLNTFTSAEQLLFKVLGLMTHDEAHQLTENVQEPPMHVRTWPSTSSHEDRWVGVKRSLPSKELFMLGLEKKHAVAELKSAVLGRKAGG